uniref:N/A n=1 Tax=Ganoderma boninense TaxID=34458 RepID=A0A5K1JVE2_9APHY|nr:N/A [Ganoderma boninense]
MQAAAFSLLFLWGSVWSPVAAASYCRCLYGDPCWPSQQEFDQLASQVSQPLIHPIPPASQCYTSPNSSECIAVTQGWFDGNWRSNQSGAMQNVNYEAYIFPNGTIDACYLNTTLGAPCKQGSVSVIGVDARTVEDVQAAVVFAAKHDLRLVVKNTGHDYLGRSDGRGSFLVWTHHMKNITVQPSFHPTGAPTEETYEYAITLGSGVQWHEAYAAASAANRTLVGGASLGGSVGAAGGWLLGAGHSALSPSYGLGVDNVLEFSLATSAGTYLTANAYQHPDLFWALRGGGGGTFGVVTSVTYQTRPSTPVVAFFLAVTANSTRPNAALSAAFAEFVRVTPALEAAGWGGYSSVSASPDHGHLSFVAFCIVPNVTFAQGNATVLPFLDYVRGVVANSSASGNPQDVLELEIAFTTQFGSFYEWYDAVFTSGSQVGFNVQLGSWLLPTDVIEEKYEDVAQTLLGIEGGFNYYVVAGGAVSKVAASDKGLNPAWRRAAVHVVLVTDWPDGATAVEINQARAGLKANTATLRTLAPESGAYLNEASPYEPHPEQAFFGAHYGPLRAIKALYDPLNLFVVAEGVGSAEWDAELTCRA